MPLKNPFFSVLSVNSVYKRFNYGDSQRTGNHQKNADLLFEMMSLEQVGIFVRINSIVALGSFTNPFRKFGDESFPFAQAEMQGIVTEG